MKVEVNRNTLDLITSMSEILEGAGLALLAATAVLLAGSVLGFGLIVAVVFTAVVIHSGMRYV